MLTNDTATQDRTDSLIRLDEGGYHDFEGSSTSSLYIIASKPVLMAQFCKSFGAEGLDSSSIERRGDPFMTLVTPVSHWLSRYRFSTFEEHVIAEDDYQHFLGLVVASVMVEFVLLDGFSVHENSGPTTFNIMKQWSEVRGTNYSVAVLKLESGVHELLVDQGGNVGATLYGIRAQESYGHYLGQRLDIMQGICVRSIVAVGEGFDNDCDIFVGDLDITQTKNADSTEISGTEIKSELSPNHMQVGDGWSENRTVGVFLKPESPTSEVPPIIQFGNADIREGSESHDDGSLTMHQQTGSQHFAHTNEKTEDNSVSETISNNDQHVNGVDLLEPGNTDATLTSSEVEQPQKLPQGDGVVPSATTTTDLYMYRKNTIDQIVVSEPFIEGVTPTITPYPIPPTDILSQPLVTTTTGRPPPGMLSAVATAMVNPSTVDLYREQPTDRQQQSSVAINMLRPVSSVEIAATPCLSCSSSFPVPNLHHAGDSEKPSVFFPQATSNVKGLGSGSKTAPSDVLGESMKVGIRRERDNEGAQADQGEGAEAIVTTAIINAGDEHSDVELVTSDTENDAAVSVSISKNISSSGGERLAVSGYSSTKVTAATPGAAKETDQRTLLAIVIPISIVVGLPLLFCLCVASKSLLGGLRKRKQQKTPQQKNPKQSYHKQRRHPVKLHSNKVSPSGSVGSLGSGRNLLGRHFPDLNLEQRSTGLSLDTRPSEKVLVNFSTLNDAGMIGETSHPPNSFSVDMREGTSHEPSEIELPALKPIKRHRKKRPKETSDATIDIDSGSNMYSESTQCGDTRFSVPHSDSPVLQNPES